MHLLLRAKIARFIRPDSWWLMTHDSWLMTDGWVMSDNQCTCRLWVMEKFEIHHQTGGICTIMCNLPTPHPNLDRGTRYRPRHHRGQPPPASSGGKSLRGGGAVQWSMHTRSKCGSMRRGATPRQSPYPPCGRHLWRLAQVGPGHNHQVGEAAGQKPGEGRGRGGATPAPEAGRPHHQRQRHDDGKPAPNICSPWNWRRWRLICLNCNSSCYRLLPVNIYMEHASIYSSLFPHDKVHYIPRLLLFSEIAWLITHVKLK